MRLIVPYGLKTAGSRLTDQPARAGVAQAVGEEGWVGPRRQDAGERPFRAPGGLTVRAMPWERRGSMFARREQRHVPRGVSGYVEGVY